MIGVPYGQQDNTHISTKYCREMYTTHYVGFATDFERRMNDEKKVYDEYSVDMTECGTFIQDGLIRVGGPCDSE